jgi:hypothetical protein
MTGSSHDEHADATATLRCEECRSRLAHDQRYCVECGARRGRLSELIAERIRTMLAQGQGAVAPLGLVDAEPSAAGAVASTGMSRSMPSPRASASAIMAMLAFGVIVGSVTGSNAYSQDGAPMILAVAPPPAAPSTPPPAPAPTSSATSSSGSGSSSSQPAGAPPSSSSSSPSSSTPASSNSGASTTPSTLPPVKHVFVIMLADQRYDQTFGAPTRDPYLAKTLRKQGELLPNYYAVAQGDLANEIALISGQGPTPQTAVNCPQFTEIKPGDTGTEGQALGSGCVYPSKSLTLADQLTTAGKTWKAYIQDMGTGPHGQASTCRHPALGKVDSGQPASRKDPYVTWSNPLVYFHSIAKTACAKSDVGLTQLTADLKTASTTPAFSYIVPSPCDNGSDQPCVPGAKPGLRASDAFLRSVVPKIEASAAYKADGLIAITFDQAPQTGPYADASSCCNNPPQYPNLPTTTTTTPTTTTPTTTTPATTTGTTPTVPYSIVPPTTTTTPTTTTPTTTTPTTTTPTTTTPTTTTPTTTTTPASEQTGQTNPTGGGGEVGLLLISQYAKPNSADLLDYFNHYSLLSSIEQLFGLKRLGYARDPALPAFGKPQYNNYKG